MWQAEVARLDRQAQDTALDLRSIATRARAGPAESLGRWMNTPRSRASFWNSPQVMLLALGAAATAVIVGIDTMAFTPGSLQERLIGVAMTLGGIAVAVVVIAYLLRPQVLAPWEHPNPSIRPCLMTGGPTSSLRARPVGVTLTW